MLCLRFDARNFAHFDDSVCFWFHDNPRDLKFYTPSCVWDSEWKREQQLPLIKCRCWKLISKSCIINHRLHISCLIIVALWRIDINMNLFKWKIQPREDLWLHWNSCPINGFLCDKTNNFFYQRLFEGDFPIKFVLLHGRFFCEKKTRLNFYPKWAFFVRSKVKPIRKNFLILCGKNYLNYWSEQRKLWIKDSNRRRNIWNNTVCLCTARYPKQRRKKNSNSFFAIYCM